MKILSIIRKININKPYFFDNINTLKHFPSSVRYWDNSIFTYNKNTLSLLPSVSKLTIKFIKNYFYLYNKNIEQKIRKKKLYNKLRKLSNNRIFLSKGEFKHTNNKVIITLYVYNKQKNNYLLKLRKRYINKFFKKMLNLNFVQSFRNNKIINKIILLKKLKKINLKGLTTLMEINFFVPKVVNILKKVNQKNKVNKFKAISNYVNKFYKKLIKKSLKRLLIYVYYRQLIYINKSKFNYTYLQFIKNKLQEIFNKNIEFNLINLRYFYLNSDILSESILLKIKKNRRRLKKYLEKLKNKVKIKKKKVFSGKLIKKEKIKLKKYFNKNLLHKFIISNLKYKDVTGFRLETKGRLNRRYTASRSLSNFKYNGNLLNIDSSYRGLSSILLRGNLNSNLQYTKLNSKTRIGSFGIKGWVSGN